MLKKFIAKQAAKKSAGWLARKEAKILITAIATVATEQLVSSFWKKRHSH